MQARTANQTFHRSMHPVVPTFPCPSVIHRNPTTEVVSPSTGESAVFLKPLCRTQPPRGLLEVVASTRQVSKRCGSSTWIRFLWASAQRVVVNRETRINRQL